MGAHNSGGYSQVSIPINSEVITLKQNIMSIFTCTYLVNESNTSKYKPYRTEAHERTRIWRLEQTRPSRHKSSSLRLLVRALSNRTP